MKDNQSIQTIIELIAYGNKLINNSKCDLAKSEHNDIDCYYFTIYDYEIDTSIFRAYIYIRENRLTGIDIYNHSRGLIHSDDEEVVNTINRKLIIMEKSITR